MREMLMAKEAHRAQPMNYQVQKNRLPSYQQQEGVIAVCGINNCFKNVLERNNKVRRKTYAQGKIY